MQIRMSHSYDTLNHSTPFLNERKHTFKNHHVLKQTGMPVQMKVNICQCKIWNVCCERELRFLYITTVGPPSLLMFSKKEVNFFNDGWFGVSLLYMKSKSTISLPFCSSNTLHFIFCQCNYPSKNELCCLSDVSFCPVVCVSAAFSTTGFDRHTSLVFNPANPETSIEDCLAAVGDRVARELDTHLAAAVHTLLAGSVCSALTLILDCNSHGNTGVALRCLLLFLTAYKWLIQNSYFTWKQLRGTVQQLHDSILIAIFLTTLFSHCNHTV